MEKYISWLERNLKKIAIFTTIYLLFVEFNQEKVFGKPPIDKCPAIGNPLDDFYDQNKCFIDNNYFASIFQTDLPMLTFAIIILPIAIYKLIKLIKD